MVEGCEGCVDALKCQCETLWRCGYQIRYRMVRHWVGEARFYNGAACLLRASTSMPADDNKDDGDDDDVVTLHLHIYETALSCVPI